MKNFINIVIFAKDCENGEFHIILDKFNDNLIYLNFINKLENRSIYVGEIKNQHLLNIINAFLAEAKEDEYNLKNSDYTELYLNFVNLIFYYIFSAYFNASLLFEEIELIYVKENTIK